MAESTKQRERRDLILEQIKALDEADRTKVIKIRSRRSKIRKEYVGQTFGVFNGREYANVRVQDDMVGRTFATVAPRLIATARARFLRGSARKMRQVADLVEHRPVEEALRILNFTPKKAAYQMAKTLKSAVANKLSLEGTSHLNPEDLILARVSVDEAPTAKRIRYRSMGRVYRVRKKYCHLGIYLEERAEAPAASQASRPKARKAAAETAEPDEAARKKTAAKTRKRPADKPAARKTTRKTGTTKKTKTTTAKKKTKTAAKKGEK